MSVRRNITTKLVLLTATTFLYALSSGLAFALVAEPWKYIINAGLSVAFIILTFLLHFSHDVYKNEVLRNRLLKEKAKVGFVLTNMSQGLIAISEAGTISLVDSKIARLFHSDYRTMLNRPYAEFITDPVLKAAIASSLNGREVAPYELNCGEATYRLSFNNLGYSHKGIDQADLRLAIFFTDISDLTKAARIKQKFVADASHELKSPLTSIIGYQQLISLGLITDYDEVKEYGALTLKEAEKMNAIVKDMLVLSRLEGDMNSEVTEVDMAATLRQIIETSKAKIEAKDLEIELHLCPCFLKINPLNARSLLDNLIGNAIKYNVQKGKISVALDQAHFEVRDTGIGIAEEELEHVFERFYRSHAVLSEEGSGLGLAIVKHVATLYGFEVTAKSKLHEGSTFSIAFFPSSSA